MVDASTIENKRKIEGNLDKENFFIGKRLRLDALEVQKVFILGRDNKSFDLIIFSLLSLFV